MTTVIIFIILLIILFPIYCFYDLYKTYRRTLIEIETISKISQAIFKELQKKDEMIVHVDSRRKVHPLYEKRIKVCLILLLF